MPKPDDSPVGLPLWRRLLAVLGAVGLLFPGAQAEAAIEDQRAALHKRVLEARQALQQADGKAAAAPRALDADPKVAQWPNWPNWGNWPNWPNWGNWFNR